MAIGFRAAGTFATRGSPGTGALSVGVPAGTAQDDVMLLVATTYTGPTAINTPSGWTLIATKTAWNPADPTYVSALYWKAAGASEGAVSMTTAASSYLDAVIVGFTGANTTTPFDVAGTWGSEQTGPVTVPSITTTVANTWWVAVGVDAAGQVNASSFPAGWTQRALTSITVAKYVISTVLVAAAGATGATSYTRTGSLPTSHIVNGLALKQASTTTTFNVSLTGTAAVTGAVSTHTIAGPPVLIPRTPGSLTLVPFSPGSLTLTPR